MKKRIEGAAACVLPESTHLSKIDKLLAEMPVEKYPNIKGEALGSKTYKVRAVAGTEEVFAQEIYRNGQSWVEVAWAKKGAILKPHIHSDFQVAVGAEGKAEVVMCPNGIESQEKYPIEPGQSAYTPPGLPHTIKFLTDCKLFILHVMVK